MFDQRIAAGEEAHRALLKAKLVARRKKQRFDPNKQKEIDSFKKLREGADKIRSTVANMQKSIQRKESLVKQSNASQHAFPRTVGKARKVLAAADMEFAKFAGFPALLDQRNSALVEDDHQRARIFALLEDLDVQLDNFMRAGGSVKSESFVRLIEVRDGLESVASNPPRAPTRETLKLLAARQRQAAALTKGQAQTRADLVPTREGLLAAIENAWRHMVTSFDELAQLERQLSTQNLSTSPITEQKNKQDELKTAIKALRKDVIEVKKANAAFLPILDDQQQLDDEISQNRDFSPKITQSQLEELGKNSPAYAVAIGHLLGSDQVLDPRTLRRELARPVGRSKYKSRIMELEYLVNAARRGAYVQVGRMTKGALTSALEAAGLPVSEVLARKSDMTEFEADGIAYWSDGTIDAVQHKTTTARNLFARRVHGFGEVTGSALEEQLTGASNQLSGLTAEGSSFDSFNQRIPETPPPGATRIANLRFENLKVPSEESLEEQYYPLISRVLSGRSIRGSRHEHVERVILEFKDGSVTFNRRDRGDEAAYDVSVDVGDERVEAPPLELK